MAKKPDRISINYDLTFETPFHCGTGLREGLIDRTIVHDYNGYLYVPGSTIKGVVREHCERLARMYSGDDEEGGDEKDTNELIHSPHDTRQALFDLGQHITMITRIFGSHYQPGLLFFEDARQNDDDKAQYESEEEGRYKSLQKDFYTQVRLDRPTRTAIPRALYTSEFGIRDITLHGSINGWLRCTAIAGIEQGPTYSLLLLLAGLKLLDRIGGNKSTGKGRCRCEIKTVEVNEKSYTEEEWQTWFHHLDALEGYTENAAYREDEEG